MAGALTEVRRRPAPRSSAERLRIHGRFNKDMPDYDTLEEQRDRADESGRNLFFRRAIDRRRRRPDVQDRPGLVAAKSAAWTRTAPSSRAAK